VLLGALAHGVGPGRYRSPRHNGMPLNARHARSKRVGHVAGSCLPRHNGGLLNSRRSPPHNRMPLNSRNEDAKCVGRGGQCLAGPYHGEHRRVLQHQQVGPGRYLLATSYNAISQTRVQSACRCVSGHTRRVSGMAPARRATARDSCGSGARARG
jgi:hypothetical protein